MRYTWQRLSISLFMSWNLVAAQQAPPPPNGGNNNNQIAPGTQIKWPANCMPPTGSGVYSPGGNSCVAPGTAANAAGTQGQAQYNLDGSTFGASTSTYDPTQDTWYNDMAANKGPVIDVTHKDFAAASGCPIVTKNGTNDITCNAQKAINWGHAHANNSNLPMNIYIPAGLYKLCGTLYIAQGDHIRGDSEDATTLQMCPGGQSAIVVASGSDGQGGTVPAYGNYPFPQGISNLTILGQGSKTTGTMIEAFAMHLYVSHVAMGNHGGRGLVLLKNAERGHFENMPTVNVRWPVLNVGANENYFSKVDPLTPGVTASPENYCYSVNCVNGVMISSGNWYVEHHNAITLIGDNLTFEYSSPKSMPFLSAICYSGRGGKIAHIYTEGNYGGVPLINSSFQSGCYENNNKGTALSQATTPTGDINLVDVSWMDNYINETNLTLSAGMNVMSYDIVPADVLPGSTNPSTAFPSVQQGQFERITIVAYGPDKKSYGTKRCQPGSTACTPGSAGVNNPGLSWPAGSLAYQVIGGSQGVGPHLEDVHFNVATRGSIGGYTAMLNDQVVGQQAAEVIVGPVLDGVEINLPGSPGYSVSSSVNWYSLRQGLYADQMDMSGWLAGNTASGIIKVFVAGAITCRQLPPGATPPNANIAPGYPWAGQQTNNGCQNYSFPQYPGGGYPWAYFMNPTQGARASTNVAGATGTISQVYFNVRDVWPYGNGGGTNSPGGFQFWDGHCAYDQGPTFNNAASTTSRFCKYGGPDYTAAAGTLGETIDTSTNNGISWSTQYKATVDGAGHTTLWAGADYIGFSGLPSSTKYPVLLSPYDVVANRNWPGVALVGRASGGAAVVSKANFKAAGDVFDVYTNDGVQLMGLNHSGGTILGPMSQGAMNNVVRNSYNLAAATWTPTNAPTITPGQPDGFCTNVNGGTTCGSTATKIVTTVASTTLQDNYTNALSTANVYINCIHAMGGSGGETIQIGAFLLSGPVSTLTTSFAWYCVSASRSFNQNNAFQLLIQNPSTIIVDATLTVLYPGGPTNNILPYTGPLPLYMPTTGTAYPTPILAMAQGNNLIAPAATLPAVPFMQNLIITTGICTATGSSYATCNNAAATNWPTTFGDTLYSVTCTGITPGNGSGPTGSIAGGIYNIAKTATGITPSLQTYTSSGFSYAELDCVAKHN